MKLTEATKQQIESFTYRAVDGRGEFHIFPSRSAKRRWQKKNGVTGAKNPLHAAQTN